MPETPQTPSPDTSEDGALLSTTEDHANAETISRRRIGVETPQLVRVLSSSTWNVDMAVWLTDDYVTSPREVTDALVLLKHAFEHVTGLRRAEIRFTKL